jgi:hypothetical protein
LHRADASEARWDGAFLWYKSMKSTVTRRVLELIAELESEGLLCYEDSLRHVTHNNRKKIFEVRISTRRLAFPFFKADPAPTIQDPVIELSVDPEAGREAFTYVLHSGLSGTVHVEQVLEYNRDPSYLRNLLLYRLTLEAQRRIADSPLSKREIVRRLGTSAAQLYRLLDQTNYRKSIDQVLALLQVLNCDIDLVVRTKTA